MGGSVKLEARPDESQAVSLLELSEGLMKVGRAEVWEDNCGVMCETGDLSPSPLKRRAPSPGFPFLCSAWAPRT